MRVLRISIPFESNQTILMADAIAYTAAEVFFVKQILPIVRTPAHWHTDTTGNRVEWERLSSWMHGFN